MSNKKDLIEETIWTPSVNEEVIFRHYDGVEEVGTIVALPDETRRKYLVKLETGEVPINLCYLHKKA